MSFTRYAGDPRWITARFNSTCPQCQKQIKRGDSIFYYPKGKRAFCKECGDPMYAEFADAARQEDLNCASMGYEPDSNW